VRIRFRQTGPREGVGLVGPTGEDGGRRGPAGAAGLHQVSGGHSERIGRAAGAVQLGAAGSDQAAASGAAVRRVRRPDGRAAERGRVCQEANGLRGQGGHDAGETHASGRLPVFRAAAVPAGGRVLLRGRFQRRVNFGSFRRRARNVVD